MREQPCFARGCNNGLWSYKKRQPRLAAVSTAAIVFNCIQFSTAELYRHDNLAARALSTWNKHFEPKFIQQTFQIKAPTDVVTITPE